MSYSKVQLTSQGQAYLEARYAGSLPLEFTKIDLSSRIYAVNDISALMSLADVQQSSNIRTISSETAPTEVEISAFFSNESNVTGFTVNSIGIYFLNPSYPVGPQHLLYGVALPEDNPIYITPPSTNPFSLTLRLTVAVAGANVVNLTVSPTGIATIGDLKFKADKLMATNLVTNGDFSQGTTGWISDFTIQVVDGQLEGGVTLLASYATIAKQNLAQSTTIGHKYYGSFEIKPKYANYTRIMLGTDYIGVDPQANVFTRVSGVITSTAITPQIKFVHGTNFSYVLDDKVLADNIIVIDLTATFGAGNEPTKEQMDRLLDEFPNSWFDGTQEILPIKRIPELLGEKANKTQEALIPPTLLNGWVDFASFGSPCGYLKDQFGFVHLKGVISSGNAASGTTIFNLPSGYRPPDTTKCFPIVSGGVPGYVRILSSGDVKLYVGTTSWLSLDGIIFKAV